MKDDVQDMKDIWRINEFAETAHRKKGMDMGKLKTFFPRIFEIVYSMTETDPVLMYEQIIEIMKQEWPASDHLPVHGAWNHALVPGIIIKCLANSGEEFSDEDVQEALERGMKIPGGSCGFHGACGGALGVGIAFSIVERITPLHDEGRQLVMRVTSRALACAAEIGGPRCCPRAAYSAFELASLELGGVGHNLAISGARGRCRFTELNNDCIKEKCPFFPLDKSKVGAKCLK
ncbi:MAG TPA: DUF5714 domain-containing protein [Methanomassiliicoccales archaeon]|nr:DUF5714 domain-containing protein [Methanomassiliicoccales archaeon]